MGTFTINKYVEVDVDMDEFETHELIEEVQNRGYDVYDSSEQTETERAVWELWLSWQHDKEEFFEKNLKKFFSNQLNINVR